jgi:hypothetical protein
MWTHLLIALFCTSGAVNALFAKGIIKTCSG